MTEDAAAFMKTPPAEFYDAADSDNLCFLCGEPRYTLVYDIPHFGFPFRFQRCQCGIVKQTPMPNEKFFEWFFNSENFYSAERTQGNEIWGYYDYFADEPSRLATSRLRYRRLKPFLETKSPLSIMKIGPGTGSFLHVAQEHGHTVRGCDVSRRFAQYAREHYGVHIDHGRFERQPYKDGAFDVLVLFNVIENVPNLDEFMAAISRTVKPGGLFILNVVDMRRNLVAALQRQHYFLYRPPVCYILNFFVLRRLMEKYGFKIEAWQWDVRTMHLEKIATLLRWRWLLRLARTLRVSRVPIRIPAYPSKIVVARRLD